MHVCFLHVDARRAGQDSFELINQSAFQVRSLSLILSALCRLDDPPNSDAGPCVRPNGYRLKVLVALWTDILYYWTEGIDGQFEGTGVLVDGAKVGGDATENSVASSAVTCEDGIEGGKELGASPYVWVMLLLWLQLRVSRSCRLWDPGNEDCLARV